MLIIPLIICTSTPLYHDVLDLCSTYTTLLQTYQTQAVNWRDGEISDAYESEYNIESEFGPAYNCWKDDVSTSIYCKYIPWATAYMSYFEYCGNFFNNCLKDYNNNVKSATEAYFSAYVSQYQTVCSSFSLQNIDMESLDEELNNSLKNF